MLQLLWRNATVSQPAVLLLLVLVLLAAKSVTQKRQLWGDWGKQATGQAA